METDGIVALPTRPEAIASSEGFMLEATDVEKRFGATSVLKKTNLRVRAGEIHALLGGNGAGKSTLIRIISGVIKADAGRVLVGGSDNFEPSAIAVVFQDLALLPHLSVGENIRLPHQRRGWTLYGGATQDDEAARALRLIDPGLVELLYHPVRTLDLHKRQLVEIARALSSGARLLLLDEPTANLTFGESERLFAILRRLARDQGISILLVSHRMNEIRAVADVCTIIRDGRTAVDRQPLATFGDAAIVDAMGQSRAIEAAPSAERRRAPAPGPVLILTAGTVSVRLGPGDILGLAGAPEGPMDLIDGLAGAAPSRHWTVTLDGRPLRFATAAQAVRAGVGYVSGDRAEKGILTTLPILDNVVAGMRVARGRLMVRGDELRKTELALQGLSIKAPSVDALPRTLSGGTQQKLLLARWLDPPPRILVLEEPTRGVDIGTKRDIYGLIRAVAEAGTIVVWWSTEFCELTEICDRAIPFDLLGEPAAALDRVDLTEFTLAQATGMAA